MPPWLRFPAFRGRYVKLILISIYVRANGKVLSEHRAAGATVPNASSRFQQFVAGRMIASDNVDEAVVSERFTRDFGFEKPADAIGKTVEFLAPEKEKSSNKTAELSRRLRKTRAPQIFSASRSGTNSPPSKVRHCHPRVSYHRGIEY